MTEPTRYIRKAISEALTTPNFKVYEQNPPGSAVTPYGIITVSVQQRPVKGIKIYTASIDIDIYHEFREYGGRKTIDELCDNIIELMVPNDALYISISGFEHSGCRLLSTTERADKDNSVTSYIKTLRFQSIVNE